MELLQDVSLKPYHTFGTEAKASNLALLRTDQQIAGLMRALRSDPGPLLILGSGSNVLFTRDFPGTVAIVATRGIHKLREDDHHVWVRVAAGENWDDLVKFCVEQGWGGLENLSLIPGTVGAAPVQNIGAYGAEVGDSVSMIEALDRHSLISKPIGPVECGFGYRRSIFKSEMKERLIILNVTFRLSKNPMINTAYGDILKELSVMEVTSPSLKDVREAIIRIRRRKLPDPAVHGNAGSFFRNPVIPLSLFLELQGAYPEIPGYPGEDTRKVPAAWLIEQCGWKGYRRGDAGVHPLQPLVLVNYGNATGKEILELSEQISQSVKDKFGICLEPEVSIL